MMRSSTVAAVLSPGSFQTHSQRTGVGEKVHIDKQLAIDGSSIEGKSVG